MSSGHALQTTQPRLRSNRAEEDVIKRIIACRRVVTPTPSAGHLKAAGSLDDLGLLAYRWSMVASAQKLSSVTALREASEAKRIVRIWRRGVEKWPFDTYVLAVGKKFVLLQPIRERIDFDGYDAIRVEHITKIERCPREDFFRRALQLKKQRRRHPRGLNLDSARELLVSVDKAFPLAVIHRELVRKDECEIGRLESASTVSYLLRSMDLVGAFEDDATKFRLSDVTRVSFDGAYENALALVAGLRLSRNSSA